MPRSYTEDEVRKFVQKHIEDDFNSYREAAEHYNVTGPYISGIMRNQCRPSPKICKAIGYEREKYPRYRKVEE